eukprot:Nk52_evm40s24 gene=Nk52_evmTU40s24
MYFPVGYPRVYNVHSTQLPPWARRGRDQERQGARTTRTGDGISSPGDKGRGRDEDQGGERRRSGVWDRLMKVKYGKWRDRSLYVTLSKGGLFVWSERPHALVGSHHRSVRSVLHTHGDNMDVVWRPNLRGLAVFTSHGYVLLYTLHHNVNHAGRDVVLKEGGDGGGGGLGRHDEGDGSTVLQYDFSGQQHQDGGGVYHARCGLGEAGGVPACVIELKQTLKVESGISSACALRDEVLVCTPKGECLYITWGGELDVEASVYLKELPVVNSVLAAADNGGEGRVEGQDKQKAGVFGESSVEGEGEGLPANVFVTALKYNRVMKVFVATLSNGRAACLLTQSEMDTLCGVVLVPGVMDCSSLAINPKYRLLCFGCEDSSVKFFRFNRDMKQLTQAHTIRPPQQNISVVGAGLVSCLLFSPDYSAIVVGWANCGFSVWSVFGSLLMCSISSELSLSEIREKERAEIFGVADAAWSSEGLHLLVLPNNECGNVHRDGSLFDYSFARSVFGMNPSSSNGSSALLLSDDRLFLRHISADDPFEQVAKEKNHSGVLSRDNEEDGSSGTMNGRYDGLNSCDDSQFVSNANNLDQLSFDEVNQLLNTNWDVIMLPLNYGMEQWPVKYVGCDEEMENVAIAGKKGFAVYSCGKRKWKLFRNQTQERSIVCSGGLIVWGGFVIVACRDEYSHVDEVRWYPLSATLDHSNVAHKASFEKYVVSIDVHSSLLLVLTADSTCRVFDMFVNRKGRDEGSLVVNCIWTVDLKNFLPHSLLVDSVSLTQLNIKSFIAHRELALAAEEELEKGGFQSDLSFIDFHSRKGSLSEISEYSKKGDDENENLFGSSLLINIGGMLYLFQLSKSREHNRSPLSGSSVYVSATVCLGSSVERFWKPKSYSPVIYAASADALKRQTSNRNLLRKQSSMGVMDGLSRSYINDYLSRSLFMCSGANTMNVWVPLFSADSCHYLTENGPSKSGSESKFEYHDWCLLSFPVSVSVLKIEDAMVVGAEVDLAFGSMSIGGGFSHYSFLHKSEMFLHHLLRQLITRRKEEFALEIARQCSELPYFNHSLELILHVVLENEAELGLGFRSDAILPRIISFIRQFPQFLEVIAHCARKTEVALWDYLFSIVGDPKILFKQCLEENRLDTAASYLIILQSLEPSSVSRQDATILLEASLESDAWKLSKELIRFLGAIAHDGFDLPSASDIGTSERSKDESSIYSQGDGDDSRLRSFLPSPAPVNDKFYLDLMLSRHARKLLGEMKLRSLFKFSQNLEFPLSKWLRKERYRAAKVYDVLKAFLELHRQFHWIMPSHDYVRELCDAKDTSVVSPDISFGESVEKDQQSVGDVEQGADDTEDDFTLLSPIARRHTMNVGLRQSLDGISTAEEEAEHGQGNSQERSEIQPLPDLNIPDMFEPLAFEEYVIKKTALEREREEKAKNIGFFEYLFGSASDGAYSNIPAPELPSLSASPEKDRATNSGHFDVLGTSNARDSPQMPSSPRHSNRNHRVARRTKSEILSGAHMNFLDSSCSEGTSELRRLYNLTVDGKCYDWSLMIAIMLLSVKHSKKIILRTVSDKEYDGGITGMKQKIEQLADAEECESYRPFLYMLLGFINGPRDFNHQ